MGLIVRLAESVPICNTFKEKLGRRVLDTLVFRGDDVLILDRFELLEDARLRLDFLSDITAVDYWKKQEPRFEVVYQVVSVKGGRRLRVRVPVPEDDAAVESLTPLWKGANFLEREFGTYSASALSIIRICGGFCSEEFQGHPLRKDYPVNLWQPRFSGAQGGGNLRR